MKAKKTRKELRCTLCSRRPLLAHYGHDESGNPYVHMRVYKQHRIYGESIVHGGTVSILCRECHRWTKIRLTTGGEVISPPSDAAPELPKDDSAQDDPMLALSNERKIG